MKFKLLKNQIMLLIVVSIAIIIISQFIFIYAFSIINQKNYSGFLEDTIMQLKDNFINLQNRLMHIADVISYNQNTFLLANENNLSEKISLSNSVYLMIESIKTSNSNIAGIMLTDLDMVVIGDATKENLYVKSHLKRLYEAGELEGEDTKHMSVYNPIDGKYQYFSLTPSFHIKGRDHRLFTVIFYDIDSWKSLMINIEWNEGYIILADEKGNILGSGKNVDKKIDLIRDLPFDMDFIMHKKNGLHSKNNAFYYKTSIDSTKWMIIGMVPKSSILNDILNLVYSSIVLVFIVAILLIILGLYINHNIAFPITQMTNFMKNISGSKDISSKLVIKNSNEIGMLANDINMMLIKINAITKNMIEAQQKLYEAQIAQQQAEISAFESQVNPHFLYNTLDCIHGISYARGVPEIAQMVRSMAHIFRYSIKEPNFVKVRDEIYCIKEYMNIIQIRFDNRFTVNYEISIEALEAIIPKMVLQPLIENAILHGLEPKTEGGELSIKGWLDENEYLHFEVMDNGIGMEEQTLSHIKSLLESGKQLFASEKKDVRGNIGILNINSRIRLLYGDDSGLDIESSKNQFTKVSLLIPARRRITELKIPGTTL